MTDSPGLHILILQVARNNARSKQKLYSATEQPIIQYLTKKFGSSFTPDDISELFHQIYIQILVKAHTYRGLYGDKSAWLWAYRIARNQALKWLDVRNKAIEFSAKVEVEDTLTQEELLTIFARRVDPDWIGRSNYDVEDQAFERILVNQLFKCAQHLNTRELQVIRLYHYQNMNMEEIAHSLGVTRPRIHQILQSAYKKCRALMDWK